MPEVADFNANALGGTRVEIELNAPGAGSGYDQMNVRGTVNLTTISLIGSVGFSAGLSNQFTIPNNDGTDAVTGTFPGRPQNDSVTFGDHIFRVSYTGGTGNDVMLTKIGDVYRPALSIQRIPSASVRLVWPTNNPPF